MMGFSAARAVRALLLSKVAITSVIGDKVFCTELNEDNTIHWQRPEDVERCILIAMQPGDRDPNAAMAEARFDLVCFAPSEDQAIELGMLIESQLQDARTIETAYGVFADFNLDETWVPDREPETLWPFASAGCSALIVAS